MPIRVLVSLLLAVILAAGLSIAAAFHLGLPLAALLLAAVAVRIWLR